ncbi:MAG: hypothetical protein R2882_06280 [Gemmatimonadales bacterium]
MLDYSSLADRLAVRQATPRFQALLIGAFAVVALLLAAIGLYATLVLHRSFPAPGTRIRIAMGADHGSVYRLIKEPGLRSWPVGRRSARWPVWPRRGCCGDCSTGSARLIPRRSRSP